MKWDWRNSKTLVRLSGPGLFNLRLFGWSYLLLFIPQILFDVVAYESSTLLWLPIWTAGHLAAALAAFLIRGIGLDSRLEQNPSILLNIAVAALLGIIRVTFIGYTSFRLGLAPEFDLGARVIAGAILGILLFFLLVSILNSNRDYQLALSKLLAAQSQLANLRKAKQKEISIIERELEASTRAAIEPKLQEIAEALNSDVVDSAARRAITNQLKDLLENQIRPLTPRLRTTSRTLNDPKKFQSVSRLGLLKIPDRMNPDLALKPLQVFLMLAALIPFSLYVFEGQQWIPAGFLIAAINAFCFWALKALVQPFPSIPTFYGIAALLVFVLSQAGLDYLLLNSFGFPERADLFVSLLIFLALFLTTVGYGLVATYEYNQENFLKKLATNNKKLERELALLNQRLWVEKRQWALRIHGSVQGSLTAAITRLSSKNAIGDSDFTLIKQHISQARAGLTVAPLSTKALPESLKMLKDTWKGIVKITIDTRSEPAELVIADQWASACANEIIKEALSNSVKHGKADSVKVWFEQLSPGFVEILVQDNGRGIANQFRPGLGSQLIDEIAFPWSITKEPKGGSLLRARIPVSRTKATTSRKKNA